MRYDEKLAKEYNFDAFTPGKFNRFWNFPNTPGLGQPGLDFPLWDLANDRETSLHGELQQHRLTVVEFGSLSCPLSRQAREAMEELADNSADDDVGGVLIYTHEAHPAENAPPHRSMEDKQAMARRLAEMFPPIRPILLDALDGACHRAYGGMPNMTWVFNQACQPVFKAEWTVPAVVAGTVSYQLQLLKPLAGNESMLLHAGEMVMGLVVDTEDHDCIMEDTGEQAIADFRETLGGEWANRVIWPSREIN
jgi:hypothetical protein